MKKIPKLLFLMTEDWFFCSHFIERAVAARDAGYDVVVVARESKHGDLICAAGLRLRPLAMNRRGLNPFGELKTLFNIWKIYRSERPDLLHHVGMKPILYGTCVARALRIRRILNAPIGMGYIFSSRDLLARALQPFVSWTMGKLLNPPGSKVVFENNDDLSDFVANGTVQANDARLIRGAGVNLNVYHSSSEPDGAPVVILIARMLQDKGVREFVDAARQLLNSGARFLLVGAPDFGNPAAIAEAQLRQWTEEGVVEWLGHSDDIPALLAASHIVCLPSYREGLPKSLIEALAAGRPVVTTDVPGCREVVQHGKNGLLVPARDSEALARALLILICDQDLRLKYGKQGRERAAQEFSSDIVIEKTLNVYREIIS